VLVRNSAARVMQGKGPGDRPLAMGGFKGSESSEQGRRLCSDAAVFIQCAVAWSAVAWSIARAMGGFKLKDSL
jgi:HEAT repeat protein